MTIAAFQELLADRLGVPTDFQEILAGFPPTLVQMPPETSATPLSTLGIANGDTLVLRRMAEPAAVPATAPAAAAARPSRTPAVANTATAVSTSALRPAQADQLSEDEQLARAIAASLGQESTSLPQAPSQTNGAAASSPVSRANGNPTSGGPAASLGGSTAASTTLSDGSCVVRRKVDDDNSCLFSAVSYVMEGSRSHAAKLRRIIADAVAADPFTYNDGFLGKSNEEYRKWILDPKKWGGAIELSIFARHFGREIAAHDIRTKRCDVYGSGEGYQERVMLIYDGLHYDALALAAFQDAPEELDVTIIEPAGEQSGAIAQAAAALTAEANQARQFTDTASFTLRCGTCKIGVKGEKEALEHAKATGHANFSEYH